MVLENIGLFSGSISVKIIQIKNTLVYTIAKSKWFIYPCKWQSRVFKIKRSEMQ